MASGQDMQAARATYEGFITLIKIGAPVVIVITATVIFLLTH
jgi:hypothetical protein